MIRSLWQYVLVGLMALGLWRLVQDRRQLKGLRTEANRLAALVGEIDLEDPSRIHVVSVPDDRPNEFSWRVFLPAEHAWAINQHMGSGGRSSHNQTASSSPNDMLVRFRMTETESGWTTFLVHDSGTNSSSMPSEFGAFLDEHWNELKIQIAGSEGELTLETDQVLTLLRIEVPEELIELAEAKLIRHQAQRLRDDPLIKIEIGSDQAFALRAEQAKQELGEMPR
jgi:hypothetical protein